MLDENHLNYNMYIRFLEKIEKTSVTHKAIRLFFNSVFLINCTGF